MMTKCPIAPRYGCKSVTGVPSLVTVYAMCVAAPVFDRERPLRGGRALDSDENLHHLLADVWRREVVVEHELTRFGKGVGERKRAVGLNLGVLMGVPREVFADHEKVQQILVNLLEFLDGQAGGVLDGKDHRRGLADDDLAPDGLHVHREVVAGLLLEVHLAHRTLGRLVVGLGPLAVHGAVVGRGRGGAERINLHLAFGECGLRAGDVLLLACVVDGVHLLGDSLAREVGGLHLVLRHARVWLQRQRTQCASDRRDGIALIVGRIKIAVVQRGLDFGSPAGHFGDGIGIRLRGIGLGAMGVAVRAVCGRFCRGCGMVMLRQGRGRGERQRRPSG